MINLGHAENLYVGNRAADRTSRFIALHTGKPGR